MTLFKKAKDILRYQMKGVYKGRKAALTDDQIEDVRRKIVAGVPKAKIAREYKCSRETIYKYVRQGEAK